MISPASSVTEGEELSLSVGVAESVRDILHYRSCNQREEKERESIWKRIENS
ncbi:uncharacterized protein G2W53_030023 [Senna tora]|uniref:Uncharacterized protein n=1 Tax=Senna tora TaxID=362788 RepID=A0A834T5J2_9FABA|nr:uncharacterized protein G2W53_030023 [Senna tora]